MKLKNKISFQYDGKGKTYIKVQLLAKARNNNYKRDVINMEIKSKTHHIAGDMTEEEALMLSDGLIHAILLKMQKEKRI